MPAPKSPSKQGSGLRVVAQRTPSSSCRHKLRPLGACHQLPAGTRASAASSASSSRRLLLAVDDLLRGAVDGAVHLAALENRPACAQLLEARGFGHDTVHLGDEVAAGEHPDTGLVTIIRSFFAEVFGPEQDVTHYARAVHGGGAVVKIDIPDDARLDAAREALREAGAVTIEEHTG